MLMNPEGIPAFTQWLRGTKLSWIFANRLSSAKGDGVEVDVG